MVHLLLKNIKEIDKKTIGKRTFGPTKNNLDEYFLVFSSNDSVFVQLILYQKLMKFVKIKLNKISYKYKSLPYDGILISGIISIDNPLEISFFPIDLCSDITIQSFKINLLNNISFSKIDWDNIFIINLKRRSDRKNQMEEKLSKANIFKYEYIDGIDGQDKQIQCQYDYIKKTTNSRIVSVGHFACLLSHIKAIKLAKERGYSSIIILEDDVFFCDNFLLKLKLLQVPFFDMLYLGGIIQNKKLFFNDWIKCDKIMGAYGYLLKSNMFDIILTGLEKLTEYVDLFYMKQIQSNYSIILLNDYIKTDLTSSDTSHKCAKLIKQLNLIKM